MQTKDEKDVLACSMIGSELNEDSQLVLTVFPEIDDLRIPFNVKDLALP